MRIVTSIASEQGRFKLARKEEKTFEVYTGYFIVTVDAFDHRSQSKNYVFTLSKDKVHCLRIQDRNNYAGLQPFLAVIGVTEGTYQYDLNKAK